MEMEMEMEMEGRWAKEKACPRLLHLIHQVERIRNKDEGRRHGSPEEKKLELTLGLPGQDESSLPCFSSMSPYPKHNNGSYAQKSPSIFHGETQSNQEQHLKPPLFFHSMPANNGTQKRTAPPVVGWPPIRSSRRIIASTSCSKTSLEETGNGKTGREKAGEKGLKSLFVKINMDGVPIGRKVDLGAYDSYEKLSSAVDQLFRGLLAAKNGEGKSTEKVLDGSGEHTLVYEDNEGDMMLVGDAPWNMFVSAVKRLRVVKSSQLHALGLGGRQDGNLAEH